MEVTLKQAIEGCKKDPNFFSRFGMPEVHEYDLPPFYVEVWFFLITRILTVRDTLHSVFRFALGLPRGHAKTTFSKLLVAYGILFGLFDFVLIVGSSEDRAQDILDDINGILGSDNVRKTFGDWNSPKAIERDTREVKIRNRVALIALPVRPGTTEHLKRSDLSARRDVRPRQKSKKAPSQ